VTLDEYRVPASGPEFSRVFVVPVPVSTVRYVRGLEFRPGNARVLHHANIRVDRTRASRQLDEEDPAPGYAGLIVRAASYPDGHFLGWTPGQMAPLLPPGLMWRLHPGSDLVIEVHMVPTGKPELVAPSIGFYFGSDGSPRPAATLRLGRQTIDIPPGEKHYAISDSFVLPVDVEVQAVQPHAHYRARQVTGIARLSDGTTRWLLYIKDWDFRWQHVYRYVTPLTLPRGTTLSLHYTYDNSEENPRNPQRPPTRVRWGQQSTSEMGDLWVQVVTRNERDLRLLQDSFEPKAIAEDIIGYETMIEENPSKVSLHDDVAVLYLQQGRPQEASSHFEASVKLRPQSPSAHYNLATALAAAGRLGEAVGEFRAALELRPDYAMAWNNLGNVQVRLGDFAAARHNFREAVRVDPANAEAHYNLAGMALADGDLPDAVAAFTRAARLNPDWPLPFTSLAWLLSTITPVVR
jgi:cytochrome c-type biogenesis protein CcmH/NrfG